MSELTNAFTVHLDELDFESLAAQWRLKLDILRGHSALAFGGVDMYERWAGTFLDMLRDPAVFTYSVLFLVEGRPRRREPRHLDSPGPGGRYEGTTSTGLPN